MNETLLAVALVKLLLNLKVLAKLTKYSGNWMDMNLDKVISQLESRL